MTSLLNQSLRQQGSSQVSVSDLMQTRLWTIFDHQSLHEALELMVTKRISCLPVYNAQTRLVGIITLSDIAKICLKQQQSHFLIPSGMAYVLEQAPACLETPVKQVMRSRIISMDVNASLSDASQIMIQNRIRRLLILERGQLKGILSLNDILQAWPRVECLV